MKVSALAEETAIKDKICEQPCLTLSRAAPSAVSKVRGGQICPPRFRRVLGGFGFNFLLEPHILPRMTPDKRIYNFQIPRTTPTDGLKK